MSTTHMPPEVFQALEAAYGLGTAKDILKSTGIGCAAVDPIEVEKWAKTWSFRREDFVFDYKSGVLFIDIDMHCYLLAALYEAQEFRIVAEGEDEWAHADRYILEGHGCFKSKVGEPVYYSGDDMKVPDCMKPLMWNFTPLC